MATSIRPPSIARDVAELMKANRRVGGAIAASEVPVPAKDRLVITTSGQPATWQLSAIPYVGDLGSSLNLSLNGLELDEATDYSVDYTTGLVTFSAGQQALFKATPTPADVLTADYWTSDDLIAQTQPADTGGLFDTFNRANSTSTINPASDGGTWTDERNAWGISSNNAYVHGDSGVGNLWDFSGMVIHRDLGSTVQTVQVDVNRTAGGNNSRLYWSLSTGSPGSAYVLIWNVGNDFHLYKSHSNGTATSLIGPVGTFSLLGAWHTIKVTYDGAGTSSFYVDGASTPFQTYTDSSPLTGTRVGIGQYNGDVGTNYLYDNFSAVRS